MENLQILVLMKVGVLNKYCSFYVFYVRLRFYVPARTDFTPD